MMESSGLPQAPAPLHDVFTAVPPRYDLVNRIVTLGWDKRWRRRAALTCLAQKPQRILDLGCGTGDLTIILARLAGKHIEITGLDYSPPMLARAKQKAVGAGVEEKVEFIHGEATRLPFTDAYFDVVGISFAFRNLTYKNPLCLPHLAEVRRVLRPDGRYVIVESSQPGNRFIRAFFHLYLRTFVKPVGILLSGNRGAYRYLAESMACYYSPREVRDMLLASGFRDVNYCPLLFGAAGIYVAVK
jgi:demethylmenaquinone methyltransferase/2-methoxy-6-polyprenyl-1,4-benzoquinol methylase